MLQIISRPIYIQPTYTLHCNHVPAQQGGWTGKTSLESITDLSISCGALGFIRRMDSELKYAPPARQGICHSRPLSVAPQTIAASDFWPVATIFATGSKILTSSAHIAPPCDTVFYKPLADWQCQCMQWANKPGVTNHICLPRFLLSYRCVKFSRCSVGSFRKPTHPCYTNAFWISSE